MATEYDAQSPNGQDPRPPAEGALAMLSCREREILHLLAQGFANRTVAEELSLSEQTVKCHAKNIYRKLGVKSRVQAVLHYLEHLQ